MHLGVRMGLASNGGIYSRMFARLNERQAKCMPEGIGELNELSTDRALAPMVLLDLRSGGHDDGRTGAGDGRVVISVYIGVC